MGGWRDRAVPVTEEEMAELSQDPAMQAPTPAPAPGAPARGSWRDRAVPVTDVPQLPERQLGESGGRGFFQGLTLGYGDEIIAGIESAVVAPFDDKTFGELYTERRDFFRARNERAQKDSPGQYASGQVAGAVVPLIASRGTAGSVQSVRALPGAVRAAPAAARALLTTSAGRGALLTGAAKGAGIGAAGGAVVGFGESNADLTKLNAQEFSKALVDTAVGSAFGATFGALLGGVTAKPGATIEGLQSQVDDAVNALRGNAGKEEVGTLLQESVDASKAGFKEASSAMYEKVSSMMQGQGVPLTEIKTTAAKVAKEVEAGGLGEGKLKTLLNEISQKPDAVDFEAAQRLRSSLRDALDSTTEPLGTKASRDITRIYEQADKALETATRAVPEAEAAWRSANAFYREGAEKYNQKVIKSVLKAEPEAVVDLIVRKDRPATIRTLKEIAGPETWRGVQGAWLDSVKSASTDQVSGIVNARTMLNKFRSMGEPGLKEMFGDELPKVQEALQLMAELQGRKGRPSLDALQTAMNFFGAYSSGVPIGDILRGLRAVSASTSTVKSRKLLGAAGAVGAREGRRLLEDE